MTQPPKRSVRDYVIFVKKIFKNLYELRYYRSWSLGGASIYLLNIFFNRMAKVYVG